MAAAVRTLDLDLEEVVHVRVGLRVTNSWLDSASAYGPVFSMTRQSEAEMPGPVGWLVLK